MSVYSFSQHETIDIDSLDLENTILLFQKYETIGKHCTSKNGFPKHCVKEEKLFDNNIDDLATDKENVLSYLNMKYENIKKIDLEKDIYFDKSVYRYFIEYKPTISKDGNSCFSNPGALLMEYILFDRLENKRYNIKLRYTIFNCDIQILVNKINKNINKSKKNK